MLRALLYIFQVTMLAGVVLWVLAQPGHVTAEWWDYKITTPTSVVLLAVFLALLFWTLTLRFLDMVLGVPRTLRRKLRDHHQTKGYQMLTKSLVAMASNNPRLAYQSATKAKALLERDLPITEFLLAYAARAQGKESEAYAAYERLLKHEDAAYLGVRGLIQSAIDRKDFAHALTLARESLTENKYNPALLKAVYDLELKTKNYESALHTLHQAAKAGAVSVEQEDSDALALLLLLADLDQARGAIADMRDKLKKASRIDFSFPPLVVRQVRDYLAQGARRRAIRTFERAFMNHPHADLILVWQDLAPPNKPNDTTARLRFFKRLERLAPHAAEAHIAITDVALTDGFFGDARTHLEAAERLNPTQRVYKAFAELEKRTGRDEAIIRRWVEKAAEAPADQSWICHETRVVYPNWAPIAEPHGSFNTMVWGDPTKPILTAPEKEDAPAILAVG